MCRIFMNHNLIAKGVIQAAIICCLPLLWCCSEKDPQPLIEGLPVEIRSLKLTRSPYTSAETLIANGLNFIDFKLDAYNAEGVPLYFDSKKIVIQINGIDELVYPFRFSTTLVGSYKFSLKGYTSTEGENEIVIRAIKPPTIETISLPIVFHYINTGNNPLSDNEKKVIADTLRKTLVNTNQAFANKRGSMDPNATEIGIQFKFALNDPFGQELEWAGINFIEQSGNPFKGAEALEPFIWNGNFWPPKKYINVWVADVNYFNNGGKFSWAYFPDLIPSQRSYPESIYGVVFQQANINSDETLTHELGHVFGLFHVFNESCIDQDNCTDTWNYIRSTNDYGYPQNTIFKLSCAKVLFAATNYMDYLPCDFNTFTFQQQKIIQNTLLKCPYLPTKRNSSGRKFNIEILEHRLATSTNRAVK